MKIHGAVVLYHPSQEVFSCVDSYISYVEKLWVMDNSERKNWDFVKAFCENPKCRYIDLQGNQGIARALNIAAKRAMEEGADWLLTMDQDSQFEEGSFSRLVSSLSEIPCLEKVGIVSPLHIL